MSGILPALAQTPAAPNTCSTAPSSINVLNLERTVALTGLSSTLTPTIPTAIQTAVAAGSLELRQQFVLETSSTVITITEFAAQPSSTMPTPPGSINFSNVISRETFNIDKIYASCKPRPSVLITGTISQNYPVSPIGDLLGVPAAISLGYTTDTPAKVNNVVIVYSGLAAIYSAAATGTLTFPASSVVPPGSNAGAPVIVVAGGLNQATSQKQIVLDLTQTTSPLNLQVTYNTMQVAPTAQGSTGPPTGGIPQAAAINNAMTAQPLITFAGGKGTYAFQVTAMDSSGRTSTQTVVIQYSGI
jgi:hypothetical protein